MSWISSGHRMLISGGRHYPGTADMRSSWHSDVFWFQMPCQQRTVMRLLECFLELLERILLRNTGVGIGIRKKQVGCFTIRQPGRSSILLFSDFEGFQISCGTYYLAGAAAITFCRINAWKGFIGFFIPLNLNSIIGAES